VTDGCGIGVMGGVEARVGIRACVCVDEGDGGGSGGLVWGFELSGMSERSGVGEVLYWKEIEGILRRAGCAKTYSFYVFPCKR